jgi:hypothetical protein
VIRKSKEIRNERVATGFKIAPRFLCKETWKRGVRGGGEGRKTKFGEAVCPFKRSGSHTQSMESWKVHV